MPTERPLPRLDLHLGVHKTATTHLQRWWVACSAATGPGGARALPLAAVRGSWTDFVHASLWPASGKSKGPLEAKARALMEGVGPRALVSDENLLGTCETLFARQRLYPGVRKRAAALAPLVAGRELHVWLCVRHYAPFLRSAWCEAMRHQDWRPFRQMAAGIDPSERGWDHVVEDLLEAWPQATVHVWRYEDLARVRGVLARALFDRDLAALPAPDATSRERRSFTRLAVEVLDDIFQKHGAEVATQVRQAVVQRVAGPDLPVFDPWRPEDVERFGAAYDRSLERLRGWPRVDWVAPPGTAPVTDARPAPDLGEPAATTPAPAAPAGRPGPRRRPASA